MNDMTRAWETFASTKEVSFLTCHCRQSTMFSVQLTLHSDSSASLQTELRDVNFLSAAQEDNETSLST